MSMTRGKTKDLEANRQEGGSEAADNKSELTSNQSSFQSALKKLAYFDRSTVNILRDGGQGKLDRQRKLLGTKLDECLDLIQDIQGIFIDLDEQEEAIDSWTNKANESLEPYESSIENLDSKLSECEEQIRENERVEQQGQIIFRWSRTGCLHLHVSQSDVTMTSRKQKNRREKVPLSYRGSCTRLLGKFRQKIYFSTLY